MKGGGYTLIGLQVTDCYCGRFMPPTDTLVKDEKCNFPCPAFGKEACGSKTPKHYSIWNLGVDLDPPVYEKEEEEEVVVVSSTTVAAASSTAAVPPEKTVIESEAPESDKDKGDDDSSPNVAGIVAGVVVGVVVVAGSAAGLWFFMRRRRNSEIEEEHRRNAAVNAFISGSKPPGSSGSISMTDSRLDPVMAHRRMSDGSIADNEDYSRKILRVTNA
ncbi:Protein SLG1 [Amphichorda felina]